MDRGKRRRRLGQPGVGVLHAAPQEPSLGGWQSRDRSSEGRIHGIRRCNAPLHFRAPQNAGTFSQAYGRFESRIKIPSGQGMWSAFWLLGDDFSTAGWPTCGEIDVMENVDEDKSVIHSSVHGPGYSAKKSVNSAYTIPHGRFSDDFHLFAVEWEPEVIRFYVDDELYATRTPADLPPRARWVYDHPFFLILNLAVGGDLPGSPGRSASFPQRMLVDYVRVYSRR